jgi:hypothetical protein
MTGDAIRPQDRQHLAFKVHRLVAGGNFGLAMGAETARSNRPPAARGDTCDVLVNPGKPTPPRWRKMCW